MNENSKGVLQWNARISKCGLGLDVHLLKTAEMKFMRCTSGYCLLDHIRNEDILELNLDPVERN